MHTHPVVSTSTARSTAVAMTMDDVAHAQLNSSVSEYLNGTKQHFGFQLD